MERETGIEPASLAWKARVLPLNYSRVGRKLQRPLQAPQSATQINLQHISPSPKKGAGGGGWIRTSVGVSQQIYSLPPLATRAPLRRISNYSTIFYDFSVLPHKICSVQRLSQGHLTKKRLRHRQLVRLAGIEPTTLGFGGQYSIH